MMFRSALFFLAILVCMSAAVSFALPAKLLSEPDNKHNLSFLSSNTIKAQDPSNDGTDQICIFCHTPHSATPDSPLWSRPDPVETNFLLYANPLVISGGLGTDSAGQITRSQYNTSYPYPNGASRMCLSCHDGVTAIGLLRDSTTINMLVGTTLGDFLHQSAVDAVIDLSTSHPISFVYDGAVLADLLGYIAPGYGAGSYTLPSTAVTPLDGQSRMQCTTCHDPHDDTRASNTLPFWRQNTGNPATDYDVVCDACHSDPGFTPGGPTGDHEL